MPPNEVHMNRLPRLPLTVFQHPYLYYARGHQSLARDQLEYVDLGRRPTAALVTCVLVREQHALNTARVARRYSVLPDGLKQLPTYCAVGGWVWIHNNTASAIRQGAQAGTDSGQTCFLP